MTARRVLAGVAAALLLLSACDGSPSEPDAGPSGSPTDGTEVTDASSDPPIDQADAVTCPDAVVEPDPGLPDAVPAGATSVRLCAGGDDEVTAPEDALVTDVPAVVAAVNGQRVTGRSCADLKLPTYQLAFGYPDGSTFVVAGRFTGCGELLVGSGRRAQAGPPLRAFIDRLLQQRESATPPDRAGQDSLDCAQPREDRTWPLGDPTGLTVAVVCSGDPEHPGRARQVRVPSADLATLADSMARTVETGGAFCPPRVSRYWIVGRNAWGDPVTLDDGCIGLAVRDDRDWVPRGPARALLTDLVAQAR